MPIVLPALPYDKTALEPHMSARTLEFHHGKHHKAYIDNTNAAIKGTRLEGESLTAVIKAAHLTGDKKLFNNSAQAWNHAFFWRSLSPRATAPSEAVRKLLDRDLGGLDGFKKAFKAEAVGHFGAGWAWLVLKDGKLAVTSYHDADTPLIDEGVTPLLTADVWEHAYYLDYQNARPNFLDAFLDYLVNWDCVTDALKL